MYHDSAISRQPGTDENKDGNRKPVEGDCPICFMEFEPDKEEIVWCRAACGNNIHQTCFRKWAATQQAQGVRCVYWYVHSGVASKSIADTYSAQPFAMAGGYI